MKATAYIIGILSALPGLCFAGLADFGAKTQGAPTPSFAVVSVEENSPAEKIGLIEGDLVTKIDGREISPTTSLGRLIAGLYPVGSDIEVSWTRDGEEHSANVTLDRELTKRAFNRAYPQNLRGSTMMVLGGGNDMEKEIQEQLQRALEMSKGLGAVDEDDLQQLGNSLQFSLGGSSGTFQMSSTTATSDGERITVSAADGDERDVKIVGKDGKVIFDDTITEEEIDKVPEEYRERVKGMMSNNMNIRVLGGGSAIRGDKRPEKDVDDLLDEIEAEEAKAKEETKDVDDLLEDLESEE